MNDSPLAAAALVVPGTAFVLAELHAMKLDGVLVHVIGEAFRPAGTDETPALRAAALQHHIPAALTQRAALGQLSAAWVYGCAPLPQVIALLLDNDGNSASLPPFSGCTVRQVYFERFDVQGIGGVPVTSPLRTALDVARSAPEPLARAVLARMVRQPSLHCPLGRIRQALRAAVHVPGKLRGQALLQSMIDGTLPHSPAH